MAVTATTDDIYNMLRGIASELHDLNERIDGVFVQQAEAAVWGHTYAVVIAADPDKPFAAHASAKEAVRLWRESQATNHTP